MTHEHLTVEIHPSQFPEPVRLRLERALASRRLPARFLYDSPAQAARWLGYHAAWSPSRTESALLALYAERFESTLASMPPSIAYVGLGCGGGTKDALFVRRALDAGRTLRPTVSDTSPSLVMQALLRLGELEPGSGGGRVDGPGDRARGLVIDLEVEPERSAFTDDRPTVWTAFGMVPNLEAEAFLSWAAGVIGPEDRLLVSANLHPSPFPSAGADILPQYDNPEARAWYAGAVAELGLNGAELSITGRSRREDGRAWRVEVCARAGEAATLRAFDAEVPLEAGEALSVFFSNRYTPDAFEDELAAAGLTVVDRSIFDGGEEGIWTVRRR